MINSVLKEIKDAMPKCAECQCSPESCRTLVVNQCYNCSREKCCCSTLHRIKKNNLLRFLHYTRVLFAAALGIEILCISSAVIGENMAFYFFGYNTQGIVLGYGLGYLAAGFTTFMTILGRYDLRNTRIDTCCSILEQVSSKGFLSNVIWTFKNFGLGFSKIFHIHRQPQLKRILKTSLIILITAESACILTAETVDLIFYNYSIILSVLLAMLAGSFTVVAPEAYKKMKHDSEFSFCNRATF